MSQQIDSKMASNQMRDNCAKFMTSADEPTVMVINLSEDLFSDTNCLQKTVESDIEVKTETTFEPNTESESTADGLMGDKLVLNTVIDIQTKKCDEESTAETSTQTTEKTSESATETQTEPKAESSGQSTPKYVRKTSSEMLAKIWKIFESNEWYKSVDEIHKSFAKKMLNLFNIKLNDYKLKLIIESAVNDKLIAIEQIDNKMRYIPNLDPTQFGELTNDWFCFECHSVREDEGLIGCNKCFKSFHSECLRGEHKVKDLNEESFVCLYCRLLVAEPTHKVDLQSKSDLNKCLSFVLNNLQLSFASQMFDNYAIEEKEENKVLVFKPIDLLAIRHKALTEQYTRLEEMVTDFKHFCHNYIQCKSDQMSKLKDFERRFKHEVKELKLCVDCYKYSSDISYDIPDDPHDWFTLVCDPPHEVVFAKYGKYPYWPAKVIEVKAGGKQYDVRFFDAPDFSRAIVPLQRLRPIEGFQIDDEDNDLDLPIKLMEEHIAKMRAKGFYFMPTIGRPEKKVAKKRPNTDQKGTERPNKRSKQMSDK